MMFGDTMGVGTGAGVGLAGVGPAGLAGELGAVGVDRFRSHWVRNAIAIASTIPHGP